MKIVIVGLGKMGFQIAKKLQAAQHEVYGVVVQPEQIPELAEQGVQASLNREEALSFFGNERPVVWIMIPADAVDLELDAWLDVLPAESIVIDGGNSKFTLTQERSARAASKNVHLVDVGTSGGVHGLTNGFSMMIGGEVAAFEAIKPVIAALSLPSGAYQHFGASGSGHYVKMVHNAIEYGMMQSLAEGYRMLHEGAYAGSINLANAGEVWQHGSVVTSWLNGLTQQAIAENPEMEGIDGYVTESGEARWTLENAAELGIPLPAIQAAFDVRLKSQQGETNYSTKLLAAMRNKFGGHEVNKS